MYTPRAPWKFDHVWCEGGATCTPMEVTLVFGVEGELHVLPWRLLLCLVWRESYMYSHGGYSCVWCGGGSYSHGGYSWPLPLSMKLLYTMLKLCFKIITDKTKPFGAVKKIPWKKRKTKCNFIMFLDGGVVVHRSWVQRDRNLWSCDDRKRYSPEDQHFLAYMYFQRKQQLTLS